MNFKDYMNEAESDIKLIKGSKKVTPADIEDFTLIKSDNVKVFIENMNESKPMLVKQRFIIKRYSGHEQVFITDAENPFKRGSESTILSFDVTDRSSSAMDEIYKFCQENGVKTIEELFTKVVIAKLKEVPAFEFYTRTKKAVFNPYALKNIKPLAKLPAKIKKLDVIKILANQQYKVLTRKYKYTDDYAFDAAVGFGKGDVPRSELIKLLLESYKASFFLEDNELTVYYGNESFLIVL